MDEKDKRGQRIALALGVAIMLLCIGMWMGRSSGEAGPKEQSQVSVAAAAQPVTVNILPTQWITQSGQTSGYGTAYYREAVGYISTTVASGFITYTWQSSPDGVVWFDQDYVPGMSASKKITTCLDYFGPYLRLSYATTDASVTGTVWVAVKE